MSIVKDVSAIMRRLRCNDHAGTMQAQVASALRHAGYFVVLEYPTAGLGDRRDGRIDIVATAISGERVAIELDARKPRRRSIEKLRLFPGSRVIGLRGVEWRDLPDGIDDVICLTVYGAPNAD